MQQRNLDDLSRLVGMNFSTEMYSTIEEIVREGVNAKSQWVRHMIASVLVTVGSVEHDFKDLYRYLRILQELDDLDTELLLLHIHSQRSHEVHQSYEMSREQYSRLKDGLLYDDTIFAMSISLSTKRLERLGLVRRSCGRVPYDDDISNKAEKLEDFLVLNCQETTCVLTRFIVLLQGFL